jgi:WD40 repeat protein
MILSESDMNSYRIILVFVAVLLVSLTQNCTGQTKPRLVLKEDGKNIYDFAISPDGKTIVTIEDETMTIWDVAKGKSTHHFKSERIVDHFHRPLFHPDGKSLICMNHSKVVKVEIPEGKSTVLLERKDDDPRLGGIAIDKDGHILCLLTKLDKNFRTDGRVRDLNTGKDIYEYNATGGDLSPDGTTLIVQNIDEKPQDVFEIWDIATKKLIVTRPRPDYVLALWKFGDDSKSLYFGCTDLTVIWDARTAKEVSEMKLTKHRVTAACIDKSGKIYATTADENTIRVWNQAGKILLKATESTTNVYKMSFSPQSDYLAVESDGNLKIWDVPT